MTFRFKGLDPDGTEHVCSEFMQFYMDGHFSKHQCIRCGKQLTEEEWKAWNSKNYEQEQ